MRMLTVPRRMKSNHKRLEISTSYFQVEEMTKISLKKIARRKKTSRAR